MRRALLFLILLFFAVPFGAASAHAATTSSAEFASANALYEAEAYAEALAVYERLLASGVRTSQVYANAGNAAYQSGDKGRAVLHYLRALRIDPRNDLARQNLARIQPRTNAASDDDLLKTIRLWLVHVPDWVWIVLAELAFVLALLTLLIGSWRSRSASDLTKWAVRAGGLVLLAAIVAGGGALSASHGQGGRDAVVILDGAITRVGPGERYMEQLSLPAGTLVELPDAPSQGWVRCRLKDGRTGFIRTEALEPV